MESSLRMQAQALAGQTEDLLVELAVKRDEAAFTSLYGCYVAKVYRHVYYRVTNQADAEDITEEVFIRAWKAIGRFKRTGAPFLAWLLTIAHNLIADHYKGKKKTISLDESESISNSVSIEPNTAVEAEIDGGYIRDAVRKLKGDKQSVILLHFVDGLSYKEIAQALHKSEGAIRVIQHRALRDLKKLVGGRGNAE